MNLRGLSLAPGEEIHVQVMLQALTSRPGLRLAMSLLSSKLMTLADNQLQQNSIVHFLLGPQMQLKSFGMPLHRPSGCSYWLF
jgi:hypothetical protein